MNIRQKYELKLLLDGNKYELTEMANMFLITVKSIRNDIASINEFLSLQNIQEGVVIDNSRVFINQSLVGKLKDEVELRNGDFYTDKISNDERIYLEMFDMCWSNRLFTIQELSEKYFVSRATINNDILEVKGRCEKYGVEFVSKRGKGIGIKGDEITRRKALTRIIRSYSKLVNSKVEGVYDQWFDNKDLEKIRRIVSEVENEYDLYLNDIAFEGLIVHIALSIERYYDGISPVEIAGEIDETSIQFQMAREILRRVNAKFSIGLPEMEARYIALHLEAKSRKQSAVATESDFYISCFCIKLIVQVGQLLNIDLSTDERLYEGLVQHITVAAFRKKNEVTLDNPLRDELIRDYKHQFEIIKGILEGNNFEYVSKNDDEITYILLYFIAAIERTQKKVDKLANVVVVCATGVGTSELVVSKLNKKFDCNVIGCIAVHQLSNFMKDNSPDIVISTVPLQLNDYVYVSPFLKQNDVINIGTKFLEKGFNAEKTTNYDESETARKVRTLVERYGQKSEEKLLQQEIQKLIKDLNGISEEKKIMLSELINEKTIALDLECDDWRDCIRKVGQILINTEAITSEYVNAIIQNIEEVGPYVVITKHVALPHATNTVGVNKTALTCVRLKTPVNFGNEDNDPVKFVFMLATVDSTSHMSALVDLVNCLSDKTFLKLLEETKDSTEIIEFIKTHENVQ